MISLKRTSFILITLLLAVLTGVAETPALGAGVTTDDGVRVKKAPASEAFYLHGVKQSCILEENQIPRGTRVGPDQVGTHPAG